VTAVIEQFLSDDPTPAETNKLENELFNGLRDLGRDALQWLFSKLEPELEEMPGTLKGTQGGRGARGTSIPTGGV